MDCGFAPPVASDGNEGKNFSITVSITDLIMDLRTAFRRIDYDRVEELLVEKENKLKAEIKELTEKLEMETLLRMHAEEECKERYERMLESSKKNNDMDHENIAELRIQNVKLEDEKRRAELVAESWKRKFEELSERLLTVEKGVNSFMNGDTHVGNGGKAEEPSSIQGTTDPGVSNKVIGEKDMSVVDRCDNERGNSTAVSSPLQRNDLESGNTPVSAAEVTRQSLDSPNKALLGASYVSAEDMEKKGNNVDMDDHESPSQEKTDDCRNAHLTVEDYARQSLEAPDTSPSPDVAVAGPSPDLAVLIASDNCGNAHRTVNDDARQSPDAPGTSPCPDLALLGASANANSGSQKVVIEIKDSDDDDCISSGALNRREATRDIAAAVDDIGHSSFSGLLGSLKRKWFPDAGNSIDGLNKNLVDGSDNDDDSSSSASSLEPRIKEVQLPPNFLCSIGGKKRKT